MDWIQIFQNDQNDFIADLKGLLRIPSVASEARGEYPFGKDMQDALEYMLELGRSMGFDVKNIDNYCGHIDFPGQGSEVIALVGHLDVVPDGEGWEYPAFDCTHSGDWLYGRGIQDDKGPTMAGLYAMKILKDSGHKPAKTIRLILGLDEESNWESIRYYLDHEPAPNQGIVMDADFPLVQGEKGLLQLDLIRTRSSTEPKKGPFLMELTGGTAANVVPESAQALFGGTQDELQGILLQIEETAHEKQYAITVENQEGLLKVRSKGAAAHASTPDKGLNGISILFDLLGELPLLDRDLKESIDFYNDRIGFHLNGEKIGCYFEDIPSGKTTFNVGKVHIAQDRIQLTIDIRYPVTVKKEVLWDSLKEAIENSGFEPKEVDHIGPIYIESDNSFVQILLDTYQQISGDTQTLPTVIGGATFARAVPGCLAYGPLFPGDCESEHQKNERMNLNQLLKAGAIYAEALYRLT